MVTFNPLVIPKLEIKVIGTKKIAKTFKKVPTVMPTYVMPRISNRFAIMSTKIAKEIITREGYVMTGRMRANLTPRSYPLSLRVWVAAVGQQTPLKYTVAQEKGSIDKPWFPPFAKIHKWAKFKGVGVTTGRPGRPPELRDTPNNAIPFKGTPVFKVWQKIGKTGIRPKRFAQRGALITLNRMIREQWLGKTFSDGLQRLSIKVGAKERIGV